MALTERETVDLISEESGTVFVRTRTDILKDGQVVGSSYHRRPITPDDDIKGEDKRVQAIAKAARADAKSPPKG
jgi:hypothetical protein